MKTNKENLEKEFNEKKEKISFKNYYEDNVAVDFLRMGVHTEENPVVIEDYPYGFRNRTDIRYWIETTNRGDRFCSQTLNPKTNEWNKPKKSTYSDVMILIANKIGHVRTISCSTNDKKEKANAFLKTFEKELTKIQIIRLHKIIGWDKTMEKVEWKIKERKYKNKITGEIVTSIPIMEMKDYVEVDDEGEIVDTEKEKQEKKESHEIICKNAQYESVKSFNEGKAK